MYIEDNADSERNVHAMFNQTETIRSMSERHACSAGTTFKVYSRSGQDRISVDRSKIVYVICLRKCALVYICRFFDMDNFKIAEITFYNVTQGHVRLPSGMIQDMRLLN